MAVFFGDNIVEVLYDILEIPLITWPNCLTWYLISNQLCIFYDSSFGSVCAASMDVSSKPCNELSFRGKKNRDEIIS